MSKYSVRLTIDTIDGSTGERVEPGNTVTDTTHGLTPEQALNTLYAYKALLGKAYIAASDAGTENSAAVQAVA